jgi:uncharacterized protein
MIKSKLVYINIGILLFVAGLLFFVCSSVTKKENRSNKYSNKCGVSLPEPKGNVNDFVSLFLPEQQNTLEAIIGNHEKKTGDQIAIITIDSAMLGKCSVEEYTFEIANYWGVGQKEKNNGIVIGIAPGLKKIRIENGYGIEKILTNDETKTIIDSDMIPEFKNAAYFEGTRKGLIAIIKKLERAK